MDPQSPSPSSRRQVFARRLLSTLALWSLVGAALYQRSDQALTLLIGFFGVMGCVEFARMLCHEPKGVTHGRFGLGLNLLYWVLALWHSLKRHEAPPMALDLAALCLSAQGAFLLCYRRPLEGSQTLQQIFATVFSTLYGCVFFGFVLRLLYSRPDGNQETAMAWLFYLLAVTKFSDMGAYAVGVLFGRHKMIPHISPAKSWEGLIGAALGSGLAAWSMHAIFGPALGAVSGVSALLLPMVICALAISGDLAESVLKRCLSTKDSGHALPGIGGVLDLTDSILFTAPVLYFYLNHFAARA